MRSGADPVLFLRDPSGLPRSERRAMLDLATELNEHEARERFDPGIQTRIEQAEMAYRSRCRCRTHRPFERIRRDPRPLRGRVRKPGTFASNCLLARRLAQRGRALHPALHARLGCAQQPARRDPPAVQPSTSPPA
ncbi:MAG: DUF1501 domain-containing protein [Planctomycetota bacterium]